MADNALNKINKITQDPQREKRFRSLEQNQNLNGYLFLLPLIIFFSVFLLYSFYFLIMNSFNNFTITFQDTQFVGLDNYKVTLTDMGFYDALKNTFLVGFADIFFGVTLGFLVSICLSFSFKGRKILHTLFFVPAMLPLAFIASIFSLMLEYREGTLNTIFRFLGLDFLAQRWLLEPGLAMGSVMSVSIYLIGISIMYYTADISTLNSSIFEAAVIDGADFKSMILFILFPLLKNTHKAIAISMLLGSFRTFERVYLMTGGGPGNTTDIFTSYVYRIVRSASANLGMVASAAVIVMIIAFCIGYIQLRFFTKPE